MYSERHNRNDRGALLMLPLLVALVLAANPLTVRASDEGDKPRPATRPAGAPSAAPAAAPAAPAAAPVEAPAARPAEAPAVKPAEAPAAAQPAAARPAAAKTAAAKHGSAKPAAAKPAAAPAADASAPASASAPESPTAPAKEKAAAAPSGAPSAGKTKREPARAASTGGVHGDGSALARAAADVIAKDGTIVARDALHLRLASKGGLVALVGTAGTIYDREQATRDAEGTKGVTGVHPSITIKPAAKVEASALEAAVVQAVKEAGVAGPTFAAKAADDGTVELNGEVTHEWSAVNAAKKVAGVTAIKNYAARLPGHRPPVSDAKISVVESSPEQDQQLATHVKEALKAAGVEAIDVSVAKGVVTIGGRVTGFVEAMRALRAASLVPGIVGVENKVTVPGRKFGVGETRDPQAVEREVRRELVRVTSRGGQYRIAGLGVRVLEGSVLLTGRVSTEDAAFAAVEAASSVDGVQEVVNALSYPTHG